MKIELATCSQLKEICQLYNYAREFMIQTGNATQWNNGYPSKELVLSDIEKGNLYVFIENKQIEGVFVCAGGCDPTYQKIYGGTWLNEEPYHTIHRIASYGRKKNLTAKCIAWCLERWGNLRVDTHKNNHIMQHILMKNGFTKCGTIFVEDGSERIAYQKISEYGYKR